LIQSFRIEVRGRKPRRGSARVRNYKRSKSVKNAAKLVMEYFQPYTTRDLARIVGGNPRSEMYQWALEKGEELSELMDHIPRSQILEEVMYLKTQGAQFKTEVFRAIAEKGVELKEEQMRRQRERDNTFRVFVTTEPDGRMACHAIAPTEDTKFAFQASFAFTSEQEMPDVMQDKMAMLRFADNTVFLPEVGKRVNTSFWLLLTPEEMQACTAS
jgi:hypothetical protein